LPKFKNVYNTEGVPEYLTLSKKKLGEFPLLLLSEFQEKLSLEEIPAIHQDYRLVAKKHRNRKRVYRFLTHQF